MANNTKDPTKLAKGEAWDATDEALSLAKELNVDLGLVVGTGPGGTVTADDVQNAATHHSADLVAGPAVPPQITKAGKPKTTHYFCLNADHPGGVTARAEVYDESRHFDSSEGGAAKCPMCNKAGSALVVDDPDQLPPSIQAIKDRFESAERSR
jgi:pyruvate/2-oxoglutarate dehydrogenase complex dihydrolipoamide acyltransferase (E2) component